MSNEKKKSRQRIDPRSCDIHPVRLLSPEIRKFLSPETKRWSSYENCNETEITRLVNFPAVTYMRYSGRDYDKIKTLDSKLDFKNATGEN